MLMCVIVIDAQRLGDLMTMACDLVPLRIRPLLQSKMFTSRTQAYIRARASACFVGGKSTYRAGGLACGAV